MLRQFSRLEKTRSFVIIAFALLMGLSLIIFYAPTRDTGTAATAAGRDVVAEVRGDDVLVADLEDAEKALQQSYGPQVNMKMFGGARRMLDEIIGTRIVVQEAERLGLTPSDREVSDVIVKRFTDQTTGKFVGFDRYKQWVTSQYGDIPRFEQRIRDSLAADKLQAFVTSGAGISDEEVQTDYERKGTSFDLAHVVVTPQELARSINPSDEELRKYFDEHNEEFRINEPQKKIRYLFINQNKVGEKMEIGDEELRKEYAERKPQAGVRVQQIVLKVADPKLDQQVLAKATELVARVRDEKNLTANEEAFADLARGNSEDPATARNGGWLAAPVRKNPNKTDDLYQSVYEMKPFQVGDAVFNKGAYYIFRRGEDVAKTFEESKPELLVSLRNRKSYAAAAGLAQRAADRLKESKDFQAVARELAAEANMSTTEMVKETPFIKPQDDVPDIGSSPQFEDAVKPLENPQDVGERVSVKNGFAIPMLVEKRDPRVPDFDEVREKVAVRVREELAKGRVEQVAREIAAAAGNPEALKAAAEKFGLKAEPLPSYRVGTPLGTAGTSQAADDAISALKPGEMMKTPVKIGDSWVVAGVTKRTDADLAEFGRQRDQLVEAALKERRSQLFDDYVGSLRARLEREGEIKVYDDVLAKMEKDDLPPQISPQGLPPQTMSFPAAPAN